MSWLIFKVLFHKVQELTIPRTKKLSNKGKRPEWLRRELLVRLKGKKEMHKLWMGDLGRAQS